MWKPGRGSRGVIGPSELADLKVMNQISDLFAVDRLLATGADMLAAKIGLVQQADIQLLMMAAVNAEDDIAINGLRVRRQILLFGGQCLPLGGERAFATAGIVDPIENSEYRYDQKKHQVIHHGVPPC